MTFSPHSYSSLHYLLGKPASVLTFLVFEKGNDMTEQSSAPPDAGVNYDFAIGLSFDDARNGLKYVLLRLSLLGLSAEDQQELRELARLAFNELDLKNVATRITNTNTASPLAVAIADIVQRAGEKSASSTSTKMAMLGAVFGAYAVIREGRSNGESEGVLGAIAGAVAVSTGEFLQNMHQNDSWANFIQRE